MNKWRHLLEDGEYAPRRQIVSGLTLEQVTKRPSAHLHSIYEEMWHLVSWQHIVVHRDEERFAGWEAGERFPPARATTMEDWPPEPAATMDDWSELVDRFFADLEKAYEWAASQERLDMEVDPGVTMEDVLHSLAVHSSYHFGKIVALRQMMGAWPPPSG